MRKISKTGYECRNEWKTKVWLEGLHEELVEQEVAISEDEKINYERDTSDWKMMANKQVNATLNSSVLRWLVNKTAGQHISCSGSKPKKAVDPCC